MSADATARFATPDPALAQGTTHHGFTVVSIWPVPELSGTAYVMRHDASGARLMWLATPDQNRSFAIGFKTPPADDMGVFHIIEHSVLCGSDRFPVKEPFVNLLKSSMQTFLNAMTFPDKTLYPVSSTNVADLENLMDVYLDAVLHPAIYQRPRIFEQEGWHYELESPEDPLSYNGVVFNEMKGALSDPADVAEMHLKRALFPHTAYYFESGGDPRSIPQLSYESFVDHHARHYALPNSYTILYGDLDIERELAFVSERFAGAADRGSGLPNPLELQPSVTSDVQTVEMATTPENAQVMLGYVVATAAQRERVMAISVLFDALAGSNEAPLKRAVLDAGLGDDFQVALYDGVLQPFAVFVLKGAKPGVAADFARLVRETCAQLATTGLDRRRLSAALSQLEFELRENDGGGSSSDGIVYSVLSLASWLYDDERPVDYLRYEDEIAHLRQLLDEGYFERLLREVVCDNAHRAAIDLVPVEEGDAAAEAAELARIKGQMDGEQLQQVMSEVEALREEQERPDAPEDLAKLPHLSLSDIGEAPAETPARLVEAPLPCLAHELDTHHIVYAYHYFDLRRLGFEDLPYVGLLTDLLGKLDTARLSAAELDIEVEENLGSLTFFAECYGKDDDPLFARPVLVVGTSALTEKLEALAALPSEVWSTTRFDRLDQIRDIIQQRRIVLEQRFMGSGHSVAAGRLSTYYRSASLAMSSVSGIDYYLFVKDLLAHWDERATELPQRLASLAARIFSADEVLSSVTCKASEREAYWEAAGTLGLPTLGTEACAHRLEIPTPQVRNEAFVIPSNVCYTVEGMDGTPRDTGDNGTWEVASRALSFDYLWNEVRVKGGAYGVGFKHGTSGLMQFWSYRDPACDATVERYEQAGAWLADWSCADDELEGYVVSCVASHDSPLKPLRLARRQDSLYLAERPDGWRNAIRSQMLATTADKLRALAPALDELKDRRAFCVVGGREHIEASALGLNVVELMG